MLTSSSVTIGSQNATAYWYQNPPTSEDSPKCEIKENLGEGSFSKVAIAFFQNRYWALKIPTQDLGQLFITKEADILRFLNAAEKEKGQEHVVQLVALITLENNPMALFHLYQGGDLFSRIEKSDQGLSLGSTLRITKQMLETLDFLKGQNIIHRDIKPENIFMLGKGDAIRLGDFGFAMRKGDIEENTRGTPEYMSPEILKKEQEFDFPSEVWATGCVVSFAFSRTPLFAFKQGPNWVQDVESQHIEHLKGFNRYMNNVVNRKELAPSKQLTLFLTILKSMLNRDPAARLTPEAGKAFFL